MATIYTKPLRIPEMIFIHRSGGYTGVSREPWARPVKPKPLPALYTPPVRTDYTYVPSVTFTTDFNKKTSTKKPFGFGDFFKALFWGYLYLCAFSGLLHVLMSVLK